MGKHENRLLQMETLYFTIIPFADHSTALNSIHIGYIYIYLVKVNAYEIIKKIKRI